MKRCINIVGDAKETLVLELYHKIYLSYHVFLLNFGAKIQKIRKASKQGFELSVITHLAEGNDWQSENDVWHIIPLSMSWIGVYIDICMPERWWDF